MGAGRRLSTLGSLLEGGSREVGIGMGKRRIGRANANKSVNKKKRGVDRRVVLIKGLLLSFPGDMDSLQFCLTIFLKFNTPNTHHSLHGF